jgi:hypothetical protein
MPNAAVSRVPLVFRGLPSAAPLQSGAFDNVFNASSLPMGFDAVVQCDQLLVEVQLLRNLRSAQLHVPSVRVSFPDDGFPAEVRAAVAAALSQPWPAIVRSGQTFLELRLRDPALATLGPTPDPVATGGGGVVLPAFAVEATGAASAAAGSSAAFETPSPPVQIAWTLELNLVRVRLPDPVDMAQRPAAARGSALARRPGETEEEPDPTDPGEDGPGSGPGTAREIRRRLAVGRATTKMPAYLVTHPELLQAWLELDVVRTETTASADDAPLTALLASARGQDMLRSALAKLVSRAGLRASPRVTVAGSMAPQQIAALGLPAMRAVHSVLRRPVGGEVLSVAFTFGDDGGGSVAQLQPFLGAGHSAHFVSLATLTPVLRTRWRLQPAAREFTGDVPVEMPRHAGSDETGQGTARVRVRLGEVLTDAALMALESEHGDVLRLACDEEIQLLAAWYADGSRVDDLGELGEPATTPFVVNVAPFTPTPAGELRDTPLRAFLLSVLEPLALPFVERYDVRQVDGFCSEALGALVARWSLPVSGPILDPGLLGDGAAVTGVGR